MVLNIFRRIFFIFSVWILFTPKTEAQSYYTVDTFTVQYDTIKTYKSIVLKNIRTGQPFWWFDEDFDLGFKFPFFQDTFNIVSFDQSGLGFFPEAEIEEGYFHIYLLSNNGWYVCDAPRNFSYAASDFRYTTDTERGLKVFKLEWHDVCLRRYDVPSGEGIGYFNFQIWLWENGDIDVITGKMNLTDSLYYIPNVGFVNLDMEPTDIAIISPNQDDSVIISGNYDAPNLFFGNPDTIFSNNNVNITKLPHEGFVIRFKRLTSSTTNSDISKHYFPSLIYDRIEWPESYGVKSAILFDSMGRPVSVHQGNSIRSSHLPPGYYFLQVIYPTYNQTYKLVKI